MNAKMFEHALRDFNKALQLLPNDVVFLCNRATVYANIGQYIEAEADCKIIQKVGIKDYKMLFNLGIVYRNCRKPNIALSYFEDAINLNPNLPNAFYERASLTSQLGRFDLAKSYYEEGLKKFPGHSKMTRYASLFFLNNKEFTKGWDLYKSRFELENLFPIYRFSEKLSQEIRQWEGQLNCESLLIVAEQGVGDQIIYLSMLLELTKAIQKITVLIHPKLNQLFARSFKNINFISVDSTTYDISLDLSVFDYFILAGDLGKFLRPSIESFRNQPYQYLKPDIEKTNKFRSEFKTTNLICGISWASLTTRGTASSEVSKVKSLSLSQLLPIFNLDNLKFVKLQYGDVSNEISHFKNNFGIDILEVDNDNFKDLDGLASLIQSCDFVITTSNVTAHLAGALGKKTFLICHSEILWYWHHEDESLWYPSVSIFSQEKEGDWTIPISKMLSKISVFLKTFNT